MAHLLRGYNWMRNNLKSSFALLYSSCGKNPLLKDCSKIL